jgi:hypothetical protein
MPQLQRHIIEFTHPGLEYQPSRRRRPKTEDFRVADSDTLQYKGVRQWNELSGHRRKFMHCNAQYLSQLDQNLQSGTVSFWGEWEAQSWVEELDLPEGHVRPRFVHYPFLDDTYQGARRHNTDPFVFGDHFWYTNCKQRPGSYVSRLENGSVILFGTEFKEGFRLDTVFVVGQSWQQEAVPTNLVEAALPQLRATNFDHKDLLSDPAKRHLRFYRGQSYTNNPCFFSFIPCKASEDGPLIHDRVLLSPWHDFALTKKPGAKAICARLFRKEMEEQEVDSLSVEKTKSYWKMIASYCIEQGYQLATQIQIPPVITVEEVMAKQSL